MILRRSSQRLAVMTVSATLLHCSMAIASPELPGRVARLDRDAERALVEAATAARHEHPEAFAAVAAVSGHRPESYLRTRGRRPETARAFRAIARAYGAPAVTAMLEALALSGLPPTGSTTGSTTATLTDTERAALEAGLLDAVGRARDPRALPLLRAAFTISTEEHVVRGAAFALARAGAPGARILAAARADARATPSATLRRTVAAEGLAQAARLERAVAPPSTP